MDMTQTPANGGADSGPPKGPYDFAMFVARSFGRALPVVVVVILIAYGAWRAITEMSALQTRLIDTERKVSDAERQTSEAQIKKTQAEADAKAAGERARYDALAEYSKQLTSLNTVSVDVSKRLQELVSTQIDNMKKADEANRAQDEKTKQYQSLLEQQSKKELEGLRTKIDEAQRKSDELTRVAALSVYNEIKTSIAAQLDKHNSVDDQVLDNVLGPQLQQSAVQKQAVTDLADDNENWRVRLAVALQLFKQTSQHQYVEAARSLAEQHKAEMQPAEADLFSRRNGFSEADDAQKKGIVLVMIRFVSDDAFSSDVRDNLMTSAVFKENGYKEIAEMKDEEVSKRVTRFVGTRLIEQVSNKYSYCYGLQDYLDSLHQLSEEAELVYATEALRNVKIEDDVQSSCIKKQLQAKTQKNPPTAEMTQRWLARVN